MTQTTTVIDSYAVTPAISPGQVTRVYDDAVLVKVWSTPIAGEDSSIITAVPGAGGSILIQFSFDDEVSWRDASATPYTTTFIGGVPSGVTAIRATAVGATATLTVDTPIQTYSLAASVEGDRFTANGEVTRPWVTDATPPAYGLLRSGSSVVGWALTNNSGATGSMAMDADPPFVNPVTGNREPALKVTIPDDTGNVDLITVGLNLPNFTAGRGKLVVFVYVADELGLKQIRPYVGTSGFTRSMDYTYQLSNNIKFRANGFHVIDIHPDKAATNTLLTTDTIDTVRLRTSAQAAGGAFWLLGIYIPEPTPDRWLVLTCDDGELSMYTFLHFELMRRGLYASMNIAYGIVGTNDALFVNAAQIAAMYEYGHDITDHNMTNIPYPATTPPTAQPNDAARLTYCAKTQECRSTEIALNYIRAQGFHALVQGAHDGALLDALASYGIRLCRAANNNLNTEPFMLGRQRIVSEQGLGNAVSLAQAIAWLDSGIVRAQDIVCMMHNFAETATNATTWAYSDFVAFLDAALERGFRVGSVSQWANARGFVL